MEHLGEEFYLPPFLEEQRDEKDSFTFECDTNGKVTKVKDHVNGVGGDENA